MRILLVKTSSLGDVIHNLPVATDLKAAFPHAQIDWMVEESFVDVPGLHPAVSKVIPVAIRRWRQALLGQGTWNEIGALRQRLRAQVYDAVIDTQGLIKSALLSRLASGRRHGMDTASIREPLASWLYDVRHSVSTSAHAVTRNRLLAAAAMGYQVESKPDYGVAASAIDAVAVSPTPTFEKSRYAMLLTATSRDDKLWPEEHWVRLGNDLDKRGFHCRLPAGSALERERAKRIAAQLPASEVVPPATIAQLASELRGAACVVGVDTGLVHLAAALGRPTIALYCASAPALTGLMADAHSAAGVVNLGDAHAPPEVSDVTAALDQLLNAAT